ncbi:MAG: hypothetical protein J6A97_01755 [Clostridia bacterium]|nr:hypothetical protein [Clostridia bacterium]
MKYSIESTNFDVCLQLKVFEADIKYSSNTILTISVSSDGFCANTDMDIDIKEFVTFVDTLSSLYTTLNGIAIIQEPYGERQFIEFSADRSGHIGIRGKLSSNGRGGFDQELSFENSIDQTYLPDFINNLSSLCTKYR